MLLVKSKESKNLNNKKILFPTLGGLVVSFLAMVPASLAQNESTGSAPSLSSWISVALSLFFIIAFILFLSFLMRRFSFNQSGSGQIKTIASMMVGTRERIAVIQIGDEQHLIGVTSQNINHLSKLEKPLPEAQNGVILKNTFANLLQQHKQVKNND